MAIAARTRMGRRSRKFGLAASTVLVGALALTACTSGGTSTGAGTTGATTAASGSASAETCDKPVEVSWWTQYGGSLVDLLKAQVDDFNASHPCIHVTNTQIVGGADADSERKFLTAIAGGSGPDLWTSPNPVAAQYAEAGAIVPLDDYLVGDYAGVKDWLYPQVLTGGSYNGKLYGLPESMNSQDTFYNKKMLQEAGATEPPKTLAEFDAIQAKMWKISGGQVQQAGFYPEPRRFILLYPWFGGTLDPGDDGKYHLADNAGNLALMEWYQQYGQKYPYSTFNAFMSAIGSGKQAGGDPFTAGVEGFYNVGNHEAILNIASENPAMMDNFGTMAFPTTPTSPAGEHGVYVNGNYTFLTKDAKNVSAALEFLMWMVGYHNEERTAEMLTQVGWLGGSPALTNSKTYQDFLTKNPWAKLMVDEFGSPNSMAQENTVAAQVVQQEIQTACEAVLTGKEEPKAALEAVDKAANDALANPPAA